MLTLHTGEGGNAAMTVGGSTISSGGYVKFGDNATVTITPDKGNLVDTVTVNGQSVTPTAVANSDTKTAVLSNVQTDQTVAVTFKAIPSVAVDFAVYDKNGEADGGCDGKLSVQATRNGDSQYTQTSSDGEDGTDVLSGSFAKVYSGSTVTFTAKPDTGYKVAWWEVDGEKQTTTGNTLALNLNDLAEQSADVSVAVKYELIGSRVSYSAGAYGTIDAMANGEPFVSNSIVDTDMDITFTAAPADGYEVAGWSVNGQPVEENGQTVTDLSYVYSAEAGQGASISVTFVRSAYTVSCSAAGGGFVSAGGLAGSPASVTGDTKVTFTATPDVGYHFVKWTVNDTDDTETTGTTLTQTVTGPLTVQATFALSQSAYSVTFGPSPADGGSVTAASGETALASGDALPQQSSVTFTADPADGWQVQKWTVDGVDVPNSAESNTYAIPSLLKNLTVNVTFEEIPTHTVTVTKAGNGSGTVSATINGTPTEIPASGIISVPHHAELVLTETPVTSNTGAWTSSDGTISGNTLTFSDVTGNLSCTATFTTAVQIEVKAAAETGGHIASVTAVNTNQESTDISGAATEGVQTTSGQTITFTAVPDSNEMVEGWYIKNALSRSIDGYTRMDGELGNTLTLTNVREDVDVMVAFEDEHTVSFTTAGDHASFTFTKSPDWGEAAAQTIHTGGTVTFTAMPDSGYLVTDMQASNSQTCHAVQNADHTWTVTVSNISGNFELTAQAVSAYQVNFSAGSGGTLTAAADGTAISSGDWVKNGATVIFTATPDSSHTIGQWTADGGTLSDNQLIDTIDSLGANANVSVTFRSSNAGGGAGGGGGVTSGFTLSFETNGGSKISSVSKSGGTAVDLAAYMPVRSGYAFTGWYSDAGLTAKVSSVTLNANTTLYAGWKESGNPFDDVPQDAYYHDSVIWAVNKEITQGTTATSFNPNGICTRAQTVTFLWRTMGCPEPAQTTCPFTDVDADSYYYKAVLWATEQGITIGTTPATFSPDATVTRAQAVTFLWRAAGKPTAETENPFIDIVDRNYYFSAVLWAVKEGVTNGTSNTKFSPDNGCTRAQIVTFIYRYLGK